MTPDQRFVRWVKIAIVAFAVFFIYFLVADLALPLTPQAQMTRPVLKVAPRVSGQVIEVAIADNQPVKPGDLLFRLDPETFELQVEQARLAVEQASQSNAELDANLKAARAAVSSALAKVNELNAQAERFRVLVGKQLVSRQSYEQVEANRQVAEADAQAAKSRVVELQARRGSSTSDNLLLRQARNALRQARLQLAYSQVRAERAGVIGNLQLSTGTYLQAGTPVTALVEDDIDVIADFREKALRFSRVGTRAMVAFDARPGELFQARVSHVDAGVREGQMDANGELAAPVQSDRWVRNAQRQRVHLVLEQPLPAMLPTGAKLTVQLQPFDNAFAHFLARAQIRLVSLMHYVY
ncbi:HlyD family secretion protein [Pseudomonas sp. LS1212]|uniref:HlyD family secretion protein n=1 Tax=Pseudomonas sp. LS1212 TaxID=2972478 RepID=UPI00215C8FE4|nr:HlyD family secretion protein [Pseudomonas sp. LS1212]UVJ46314.1 HlyD family secretion protein [Pseudomonas sp. LS1212]